MSGMGEHIVAEGRYMIGPECKDCVSDLQRYLRRDDPMVLVVLQQQILGLLRAVLLLVHFRFLDGRLQFDYLINNIRKKRRYSKWLKPEKLQNVELVKEYYGFSYEKAKDALRILSEDQLAYIINKLNQGGVENDNRNREHGGVHSGKSR